MPDQAILQKSVTAGDYAQSTQGGVFFLLANPAWRNADGYMPPSLDGLSFTNSDNVTAQTVDFEAIWAGAVAIAITKVSSLSFELSGDIPLRTRRGQDLLLNVDAGRGWVSFISKILLDFLTTNNGCFIEIVRAADNENAPIIGLIPLDSLRCTRTGNPDTPAIYKDLKGAQHELKYYEVIAFADMPSSRASLLGSGKCAAARSYKSIYKLACIEGYVSDKVSGRRPLALNLVNGINAQQLDAILNTAQSQADAKGIVSYMGAIVAAVPGDSVPGLATIPFADFPDNFNRKDELDIAILSYASNLGLDVQDLQPLTGQALGTGAQSQVLAEKAKGKGLAAFRQQFKHALNMWVLPDGVTFEFDEEDLRDEKLQAEVNTAIENYVADSVAKGIITAEQGLQILVDENVYPKEFLPIDQTPDDTLADDEKPDDGTLPPLPELPNSTPAVPPAPPVPVAVKEVMRVIRELKREAQNA